MAAQFNGDHFEQEVLQAELPVFVDFYADWCGPCKMMGPVVEALEKKYQGKMRFGKLNVDQNMELAQAYRVVSIPMFMIFKNGSVAAKTLGAQSQEEMEQFIAQVIG